MVLWRVVKRLSYTEDARCLKVNVTEWIVHFDSSVDTCKIRDISSVL